MFGEGVSGEISKARVVVYSNIKSRGVGDTRWKR